MKLDPYLNTILKMNSKWIKDLNIRVKTTKVLEENIGEKLYDIGFGNYFLHMTPKTQPIKVKIDKLDYIKIKNFCASKDTTKRVKRQPMELKKIFANLYLVKS